MWRFYAPFVHVVIIYYLHSLFGFYCLILALLPPGALQQRETAFASTSTTTAKDETIHSTTNNTKHPCQFCSETFGSRNALFRHLKIEESCSAEFRSLGDRENGKDESSIQNSISRLSLLLKISYSIQNRKITTTAIDGSSSDDFESASNFYWETGTNTSDACEIGQKVQEAIESSLWDISIAKDGTTKSRGQSRRDKRMVMSATQMAVANHRPSVLAQENGLSSAEDFLLMNVQFPGLIEGDDSDEIDSLLAKARKYIGGDINTSSGSIYNARILSGMRLPKKFNFHAEQDCTQRVYHYLLPLSWLPDGSILQSWCQQHVDKPKPSPPTDALARLREALQLAESTALPNRKVRRRQKHHEERMEDQSLSVSPDQRSTQKFRKGSAAFGRKERKPWHNFGHVELRGDASPNQEPVWNVLDKARIKGFLLPSNFSESSPAGKALAVLEFRGDNFLPGQIQSIVGTALAVTHGWLPPEIFRMALSKEFLLETPTAPKDRLYCAGARYHSHEPKLAAAAKQSGLDQIMFATSNKKASQGSEALQYGQPKTPLQELQEQVLERVYSFDESISVKEKQWLEDLEHKVSPKIRKEMGRLQRAFDGTSGDVDSVGADASADNLPSLDACIQKRWVNGEQQNGNDDTTALLHAYNKTLHLLREVISSGSWPETSVARSNVILRAKKDSSGDTVGELAPAAAPETGRGGGSFTVFNPQIMNNPLLGASITTTTGNDGNSGTTETADWIQRSLPLGNEKFPDLVEAVFDLERELCAFGMLRQRANLDGSLCEMSDEQKIKKYLRPASLCCAINANASFRPHVDSGRGSGQSLSLIVGLGDYDQGGAIRVEDHSHDIRYKPLEFDGWSSRHWTQPYRGERFSLVWFSPAMPDTKG